jgi:Peptidase family M20/M25/M40
VEVINGSLIFTWLGSNTQGHKKPIIFLSHMDVVRANGKGWMVPAFSGEVVEGRIYGRGTQDTKCSGAALLETFEYLLVNGYSFEETFVLAFGHDEEVGGKEGAAKIVEHLEAQGIKPLMILDEGGFIGDGFVPNLEELIAFVGVCEKGKMVVKLSVQADGGHAGMPKPVSASFILRTALISLEENPMKPLISKPVEGFLDDIKSKLQPCVPRSVRLFTELVLKRSLTVFLKPQKPFWTAGSFPDKQFRKYLIISPRLLVMREYRLNWWKAGKLMKFLLSTTRHINVWLKLSKNSLVCQPWREL